MADSAILVALAGGLRESILLVFAELRFEQARVHSFFAGSYPDVVHYKHSNYPTFQYL